MKLFIVIIYIFTLTKFSLAQVEAPNYSFELSQLDIFMPQKPIADVIKKFPKIKEIKTKNNLQAYLVYIDYRRYKFPVYIQVKDKLITDFYAKLPQYFLHNIFHFSLIKKWGMQTSYKKVEEQAVYIWKKDDITIIYSGACTITCFPVYLTIMKSDIKKSLMKLFFDNELSMLPNS